MVEGDFRLRVQIMQGCKLAARAQVQLPIAELALQVHVTPAHHVSRSRPASRPYTELYNGTRKLTRIS